MLEFTIEGPILRADLPGLCDRVCALLSRGDADDAVCDVRGVQADAVTVDALARLQLAARRRGCRVRLRGASGELRELVAFMGLEDVLLD
jgi:ABC-type transporter Mla MlaB component